MHGRFLLRRRWRPGISLVPLLVATLTPLAARPAGPRPLLPLPPGATEVEAGRYRSPLSYRATLQWFEKHLSSGSSPLTFETLVDLPDVVAAHAESPRAGTPWSGLNVSEFDGNVWIFVIAR